MVSLPAESKWIIRSLSTGEDDDALAFLREDPLANVYFISRIRDEGIGSRGQTVEILRDGEPVVLASLTSNLILAGNGTLGPADRNRAMDALAERILTRMVPVRAIISDARLVDPLWQRLQGHLSHPTVVRLNQPVYAIHPGPTTLPDLRRMRFATEADLAGLVPACAAMHMEEVGIDPLSRDPSGYRQRVRELVQRERALVMTQGRQIVFKCELSAVTEDAVQIMGVWTRPGFRRRGLARTGMAEVCGHILRQRKAVTLFVNDFNRPAIDLYEVLGFRRIGTNRALIW